jgi:integrative and conjugative element protein (TIGR02256 family)
MRYRLMQTVPTIRTVWLSGAVVRALTHLAIEHHPYEVGGLVAGYLNDEAAVVTDMVGPGPLAKHRHNTFLPDHAYQTEQMHGLFRASGGRTVYLGDWHTHPEGPSALSPLDKRTMRVIADSSEADCANPLMILLSSDGAVWELRAFRLRNAMNRSIQVSNIPVRSF